MSSLVIAGDTSGSITLAAPAVAGSNTITLPAGTGTVSVAGVNSNIVSGTVQATTSGTSIDFTGIPSWVKRITVMFQGVSGSGTSAKLLQIGNTSVETTGYVSTGTFITTSAGQGTSTAGFIVYSTGATETIYGHAILTLTNAATNTWVFSFAGMLSGTALCLGGGGKSTAGVIDRIRLTTVNGTDTFDAGSVNILYE